MPRGESLKLQQFHCPSCGQNITQLTPFKASIECPYCHQVSLNPLVIDKTTWVPERVIPFRLTKDDFGEAIIEHLVREPNLPLDLFDQITFGKVLKVYLPMYEYTGTFEGKWHCDEAYTVEHKVRRNGNTVIERETRYRPVSGGAYGNYSFLALAYEGKDIPPEFLRYAMVLDSAENNSYPFDPELMGLNSDEQVMTLEMNRDAHQVWAQKGEDYVTRLAERECARQAPSNRRNFRCSSRISPHEKGIYTMVPFWFVNFFYEGKAWNFMAEGSGTWSHLSAPTSTMMRLMRWGLVVLCLALGCVGAYLAPPDATSQYPAWPRIACFGGGVLAALCWYLGYNFRNQRRRIAGACAAFPDSHFARQHR